MGVGQEILLLFKKNRKAGIQALFHTYYRPLVLYASVYLTDIQQAEDVVQELFIKLWEEEYLDKVSEDGLKAYLFRSVKNACYTLETRKDILRESIEASTIEVAADTAIGMNQQIVDQVSAVINRQPSQTKRVLEGVLMKDLKYKEVAQEMGISINTVKTLLKIGMRVLREEFKDKEYLLFLFLLRKVSGSF